MAKDQLKEQSLLPLSIAALGVVFGDIGTSPLYALRAALLGLPVNAVNILGILSLIVWSLILVISIKYLSLVLSTDNDGEGGVLALLALLKRSTKANGNSIKLFFIIGIFGAGFMLGDGMLTPAISVLSAVEGLSLVSTQFTHWAVPLACTILLLLFLFQSRGTEKIGFTFGPVMLVWFTVIGGLGLVEILKQPFVLRAINPYYAIHFMMVAGWKGYALLGGVFLVVTGGEALYADLGHFGKWPIRFSWFSCALPALLLNYAGQAAYIYTHPASASENPFYMLAPSWFLIPFVILATIATVIASQAVITATFSLAKQAVLLGLYPHLPIIQTSKTRHGQIYIPQMNIILGLGSLLFVLMFKSSDALTHAYGIAVNIVMLLVTLMIVYAAHNVWKWHWIKVISVFSIFLLIDLAFFGANAEKIVTGGWIPILFAMLCAFVMYTWNQGMAYLRKTYYMKKESVSAILERLHGKNLQQLTDTTAVFITDAYDDSGGSFLQFLKLSHAIPEHILMVSYSVSNIPYVTSADRFEVKCLGQRVTHVILHYGFMDFIAIPQALGECVQQKLLPFKFAVDKATYFVEIPNILPTPIESTLRFPWQEKLFAFLMRNYSANLDIAFYQLPYNRTIAIGTYYAI
jgi:KUP system potassium uptake protein